MEEDRLLFRLLEGMISIVGNKINSATRGIPRIIGILKEANRFWFILVLRLSFGFVF